MLKKLLFFGAVGAFVISCSKVVQPMYVNTSEVASLTIGMTKEESKAKLGNLSPFDILMSEEGGCELHQYKYKTPAKSISPSKANTREGLTDGDRKFVKESDVYLIFKGGKLESVLTEAGKGDAINLLHDIASAQSICNETGLKGCTDPTSLNYNPNAIFDDGTCEYCPCGSIKNPMFKEDRPISDCNQKCINTKKEGEAPAGADAKGGKKGTSGSTEGAADGEECTQCDVIEKLSKSNANIYLELDLKSSGPKKSKMSAPKMKLPKKG